MVNYSWISLEIGAEYHQTMVREVSGIECGSDGKDRAAPELGGMLVDDHDHK